MPATAAGLVAGSCIDIIAASRGSAKNQSLLAGYGREATGIKARANWADQALAQAVSAASIVEKVMMRTHIAIFTEGDLLAAGPSIFRHNRYTLTPREKLSSSEVQ